MARAAGATAHGALRSAHLESMVHAAGLEVVDYLPYGAFPAYFYLFTGVAFHLLQAEA